MPSVMNFFLSDDTILSEAKKKTDSAKDAEKIEDPDVEDTTKKVDDSEDDDAGGKQPKDDSGDDLFADVDHEAENGDGSGGLDPPEDSDNDGENDDVSGENDDDSGDNLDGEDDVSGENDDDSGDNLDGEDDGSGENDDDSGDDNVDDGSSNNDNTDVLKNKKLLDDFFTLYNNINDMVNTLNNVNEQNRLEYTTITKTIENLQQLSFSINNYINLRFSNKTYEENLVMYYKIVKSVQITDKIISNIIENRNKH